MGDFFCPDCDKLQPPCLDLDYFELMKLDKVFDVDAHHIKRTHTQLQARVHPDRFSQSGGEELTYASDHSSLFSVAYKTLTDPLTRGLYLLKLQGYGLEEGTDSELDSALLMEFFEWNETVEDASPDELPELMNTVQAKVDAIISCASTAFSSGDLPSARREIIMLKYYVRVKDAIGKRLEAIEFG